MESIDLKITATETVTHANCAFSIYYGHILISQEIESVKVFRIIFKKNILFWILYIYYSFKHNP